MAKDNGQREVTREEPVVNGTTGSSCGGECAAGLRDGEKKATQAEKIDDAHAQQPTGRRSANASRNWGAPNHGAAAKCGIAFAVTGHGSGGSSCNQHTTAFFG